MNAQGGARYSSNTVELVHHTVELAHYTVELGQHAFRLLVLLLCFLAFAPQFSSAIEGSSPVVVTEEAVQGFERLLHYERGRWLGQQPRSRADDQNFFLTPSGATNAADEILALAEAAEAELEVSSRDSKNSVICRFPARYEFLRRSTTAFNEQPSALDLCEELRQWLHTIAPHRAFVVFPSSYLGNPASAFGHTLLRIDSSEEPLLGHSVGYAAETGSDGALRYVAKGLAGGYQGFFSLTPYYNTARLYNDGESRDIWEYELKLSSEELETLILHLYELRGIAFDYYYFDENCSFFLLSLLEAVVHDRDLTSAFTLAVIPSDTLKLLQQQGMLGVATFRPSVATELRTRWRQANPAVRKQAEELTAQPQFDSSEELAEAAEALDLAIDALRYRFRFSESGPPAETLLTLMHRRSLLDASPKLWPEELALSGDPLFSHDSSLLSLGMRYRQRPKVKNVLFPTLRFRAAYHDQLDNQAGHLEGTTISFLEPVVSFRNGGTLKLEEFSLLHLRSAPEYDPLTRKHTWGVALYADRALIPEERIFSRADFDYGLSFEGLGATVSLTGGALGTHHAALSDNVSFSPFLRATSNIKFSSSSRAELRATVGHAAFGNQGQLQTLVSSFQHDLNRNVGLRISLERVREFSYSHSLVELQLRHHF